MTRSARRIFGLAIAGPLLFVAWLDWRNLRNLPFQDEFATVLDFLLRFRTAHGWPQISGLLFSQENEHRIVTSRLIFIALERLFGGPNFVAIALLGTGFIAAAIIIIARQARQPEAQWLLGAILCLLVFQTQHYENLLLSYASIDHFHVVLLAAASLALAARPGRLAFAGSIVFALLAALTLAHGLAVFPAGAWLLWRLGRRRALAVWLALAGGMAWWYCHGLVGADRGLVSLTTWHGISGLLGFWLSLLGGVAALGSATLAPWFGAAGLGFTAYLIVRRRFQGDPFLAALLLWVLCGTLMIAYGRYPTAELVPPLSSRYMIQSVLFWTVLLVIAVTTSTSPARLLRRSLLTVGAVAAFSFVADLRFYTEAVTVLSHRNAAAHYYRRHGSLVGSPFAIYPDAKVADRVLAAARSAQLFRIDATRSPAAPISVPIEIDPLPNGIDELTVGASYVFIRGWLLPPVGAKRNFTPYAIVVDGAKRFAFAGTPVRRPDVAKANHRLFGSWYGFSFNIPRASLPQHTLHLSLALVGADKALSTGEVTSFSNPPDFAGIQ